MMSPQRGREGINWGDRESEGGSKCWKFGATTFMDDPSIGNDIFDEVIAKCADTPLTA